MWPFQLFYEHSTAALQITQYSLYTTSAISSKVRCKLPISGRVVNNIYANRCAVVSGLDMEIH